VRSILIVEDDAVLGSVLQSAFSREWNVSLATSADEALTMFGDSPPEVVLTDKNMPGMDGMSLLQMLRKLDPAVGIVVMTAYGTVDSARDSIDWRVDGYIEKPFPDVFALVREMEQLRERVVVRRRMAPPHGVPLRVGIACPDLERRARLKEILVSVERLGWCNSAEDLGAAVRDKQCTVAILDCTALGVDPEAVVDLVDPRHTPCLVIARGLAVLEIAKLIDRSVKALLDRPIDDSLFGEQLHRALERIRVGTL
jgi:DNA-binding NtrC family response regulator